MANITDLLRKYKSLFSTTLSGGIGTGTGDTITPSTVTGLPTDTAITLTFDRVDSSAVATPTKLERIRGIVSGGNFTSYVRGKDSTTEQAHTGGAVIEMVWNADDWNDMCDWGLAEHNQDGTHGAVTATSVNIGSTIAVTGVLDEDTMSSNSAVKLATQQSIKAYVDTFPTATSTTTFTNKRITKRITTITSHATPTINTDNCDAVTITALAEAITSMTTNLSGTPTNFQTLIFRIKDDGTARSITWGASFEAKGSPLPTTTVISKVLTVGFIYDTVTSKWGCVAVQNEA